MYPSIKPAIIRKAVIYFARKLTKETKKNIHLCLELIHFEMSSTLSPLTVNTMSTTEEKEKNKG